MAARAPPPPQPLPSPPPASASCCSAAAATTAAACSSALRLPPSLGSRLQPKFCKPCAAEARKLLRSGRPGGWRPDPLVYRVFR